jgi:hypothetical protein
MGTDDEFERRIERLVELEGVERGRGAERARRGLSVEWE